MITPKQAIETAKADGYCRIKNRTYLWQTVEAAMAIRLEVGEAPYILITDGDWSVPHGVSDERDKQLIAACAQEILKENA